MRKFFLVLSVFVLIVLLSAGIHQKIRNSQAEDIKINELTVIYSIPTLK